LSPLFADGVGLQFLCNGENCRIFCSHLPRLTPLRSDRPQTVCLHIISEDSSAPAVASFRQFAAKEFCIEGIGNKGKLDTNGSSAFCCMLSMFTFVICIAVMQVIALFCRYCLELAYIFNDSHKVMQKQSEAVEIPSFHTASLLRTRDTI
jgi:hypothetical protein